MNKKCSLIKSLLKGDVLNVSNSIRLTGYHNPSREIIRGIEEPFGIQVTRDKIETKDQFGNYAMYYNYHLEPKKGKNSEGIKKMCEYLMKENAVEKAGSKTSTTEKFEP